LNHILSNAYFVESLQKYFNDLINTENADPHCPGDLGYNASCEFL